MRHPRYARTSRGTREVQGRSRWSPGGAQPERRTHLEGHSRGAELQPLESGRYIARATPAPRGPDQALGGTPYWVPAKVQYTGHVYS